MSDTGNADLYLRKAIESLAGAQSEYANARFNNCRHSADYDPDPINRAEASRALRRGHEFVEAIRQEGSPRR